MQKNMENHQLLIGKFSYKWAMFNSYVKFPEGNNIMVVNMQMF
jgi:hypothetical protein